MKLITMRGKCSIHVDKLNRCFYDEEHGPTQTEQMFHERVLRGEHGEDRVTAEEMQSFEGDEQVREQMQVADHDSITCGGVDLHWKGNMFKQIDSDCHAGKSVELGQLDRLG